MAEQKNAATRRSKDPTLVVTGPVVMGRAYLYKPYVFKDDAEKTDKADKTDKTDPKEKTNRPKYRINLALDKETQADEIKRLLDAQEAAMDAEHWSVKNRMKANLPLLDADEDEVPKEMNSSEMVLLSEKRPQLAGHYSMTAKHSDSSRPYVRYVDPESGLFRELPEPILDPDPDDPEEVAESKRIERLWNEWVYEGQNVSLCVSFRAYVVGTNLGVSAKLNGVTILGGGQRLGAHTFEEDYDDDTQKALLDWVRENVSNRGDGSDDDVDGETGEVKPRRSKAKPKSSRRRVEPVDDGEPEEAPVSRRSRRAKPVVEVEEPDDDSFDDPDLF